MRTVGRRADVAPVRRHLPGPRVRADPGGLVCPFGRCLLPPGRHRGSRTRGQGIMGLGQRNRRLRAVARRRYFLSGMVGETRAAGRQPIGRHQPDPHEPRDRRPAHPFCHPSPDPGDPPARRCAGAIRRRTIPGRPIPNAKYVELPGADHIPWSDTEGRIAAEIRAFVGTSPDSVETDRVLVTVLFTDIVESTRQAVAAGDPNVRATLEAHHTVVRSQLLRYRGR